MAGSSLGVAVVGVVAPFALGFGTAYLFLPRGAGFNAPIFIGATLCATSIGITARVFRDMNRLGTPEARIVLGAAVLDDVLGLIVLAVVSGVITSGAVQFSAAGMIVLKAVLFLGAVIVFGLTLQRKNIALFEKLDHSSAKLVYPFALLMLLAWAADAIGLATIVGAFAAGLILEERHFGAGGAGAHGAGSVESVIAPLEGIFAPVFFVLMGMQVDVETFLDWKVLLLGLAFTLVAVLGKLAAGLAAGRGLDRLTIGIGLIPRGEVGLIFAGIGRALGVLDDGLFSIIIIVVLLTTVATPPLLTWSVGRGRRHRAA